MYGVCFVFEDVLIIGDIVYDVICVQVYDYFVFGVMIGYVIVEQLYEVGVDWVVQDFEFLLFLFCWDVVFGVCS